MVYITWVYLRVSKGVHNGVPQGVKGVHNVVPQGV